MMKKSTFSIFAILLISGTFLHLPLLATKHTVLTGNYFFNPSSLNVIVGDTIKWQWVAGNHTTTSSSIPPGAATWDTVINIGNQFYEYKVTVAGTYNYVCTPHIAMGMIASFVATDPAMLTVMPPSQNVSFTAGQTNFSITSNGNWTASSNATWCTVTPSGTGNGTMTATYTLNPGTSVRTATITVSLTGAPDVTVEVIQDASPTGIAGNNGSSVHIYPNPARDKVIINFDKIRDNVIRVQFVDLTGKTVIERSVADNREISMDVRDLPRGCYFLKVMLGNDAIIQKIILSEQNYPQ
jgi:plastocyanin